MWHILFPRASLVPWERQTAGCVRLTATPTATQTAKIREKVTQTGFPRCSANFFIVSFSYHLISVTSD
jgi:hypothetical protein